MIQPLAQEIPCALGCIPKNKKIKDREKGKEFTLSVKELKKKEVIKKKDAKPGLDKDGENLGLSHAADGM